MYENIYKTENTEYINHIANVDNYLLEDLSRQDNGINFYTYMNSDGKILFDQKTTSGFRPLICLDKDTLKKYLD